MFDFFYNILATLSGGRKFEQLQSYHLRKVQKTLTGSKFSNIDTQVFALLTQRQKGESFFAYIKRAKTLHSLPDSDKQTLINSEKKRLTKAEKNKQQLLQKYLNSQFGSSNDVQESVGEILSKKLNPSDAKIFSELAERQSSESMFAHLRRSKLLYRLPIEEKHKLVQAERKRVTHEQAARDNLLQNYLQPTPQEKINQQKQDSSQQVKNHLTSEQKNGLKL